MSDQVIINHKSNHKQLNESKNKYLRSRSIIIDYIKPGHERDQTWAQESSTTHRIFQCNSSNIYTSDLHYEHLPRASQTLFYTTATFFSLH